MIISKRLNFIAENIEKNKVVVDVGTDHGYLPIYLVKKGIAKKVVATDVSENALNSSIENVASEGLSNFIENRLGDGLQIIKPYEADVLTISGMGGSLIVQILEENLETTKSFERLILQPNVGSWRVREFLFNNGFKIIREKIIHESDFFYEIIVAEKAEEGEKINLFLDSFLLSYELLNKPDGELFDFIDFKIDKYKKIIREIQKSDTKKAKKNIEEFLERIEVLEKGKEYANND